MSADKSIIIFFNQVLHNSRSDYDVSLDVSIAPHYCASHGHCNGNPCLIIRVHNMVPSTRKFVLYIIIIYTVGRIIRVTIDVVARILRSYCTLYNVQVLLTPTSAHARIAIIVTYTPHTHHNNITIFYRYCIVYRYHCATHIVKVLMYVLYVEHNTARPLQSYPTFTAIVRQCTPRHIYCT